MSLREAPALTWTVEDAALQMGVSVATVRRLIQRGELPGSYQLRRYANDGRGTILRRIAWRVPDAAIRGWLAKQAAETDAKRAREAAGGTTRRARPGRASAGVS